ncbi:hypothetical protein A3D05_02135 [Candidatus Gottesmanbacteria bacterium RIFCSPHIGHO2_02_FULL_40_24]|nr:MAG: hypothetical protein A3D05_02135 [Candidatus Gottesmanbacteria bacterium RIFCSPHIGHO2_02_FULL_40_24]
MSEIPVPSPNKPNRENKGEIKLEGVDGVITTDTPPERRSQMWQEFWRNAGTSRKAKPPVKIKRRKG